MQPYQVELLVNVLGLVGVMIAAGGVAAYIMRNNFNFVVIIGGFLITLFLIFVAALVIEPMNSMVLNYLFAPLFGASFGCTLGGFAIAVAEQNGAEDVLKEGIAITLAVMGISTIGAALVGLFTGFNFQELQGIMLVLLFGLIGISFLAIFIRFNKTFEFILGVGASIFWMIYLVVDFNMIVEKYDSASASAALQIAMKIYADLINLFIRLLPIILELLKHKK